MANRDYQKEYWDKIHAWRDQKRAERKARENNSNFTILSMVGFALGVGLFYHTSNVVVGTIVCTVVGAMLGATIDLFLMHSYRNKRKQLQ